MKKNIKKLLGILLIFLIIGLIVSYSLYDRTKREIIDNNEAIIGAILKNHPELEKEIILSLTKEDKKIGKEVLKQYGLTSLESLDYLKSIKNYRHTFFGSFLVFYLIMSIIVIILFITIEKKQSQEIKKIDNYLFSLLEEEIKVDLKDFQSGELESLQNDLMKVTSRLKNALEHSHHASKSLSKTLADISHQLKTPLTSLSIINDALSTENIDKEKTILFLKKQEEVINHMQTLIITLLKVSQIESGMIELKKENVNINPLIKDLIEQLELLIVTKNITIKADIPKNLNIKGDYLWLKEAILNIVKNGIEHSKENQTIIIESKETPIYTELTIKDFGSGIKKEDIPHIFERFYKTGKETNSIGIGLNLSKSILDKMNATIRVKSKLEKGTTFIIHFYKSIV